MKMAVVIFLFMFHHASSQSLSSFKIFDDVRVTIDEPATKKKSKTTIIFYALPNGNTTGQSMGKKMLDGDDWRYDIQHIMAQTAFIRKKLPKQNIVVVYLENDFKSWPLWKQKHANNKQEIQLIVDTVYASLNYKKKSIHLNGHSGGGSFVFGYLDGVSSIPDFIKRISFIDSNYGYDSSYYPKFKSWLKRKGNHLTVFAYNDSVALYNGKPVVSAKGGTWYKSHLMLRHLGNDCQIEKLREDSLIIYRSKNKRIGFFFKTNPDKKIYHTQQVELNGFIHSVLFGTKKENEGYRYFESRAYAHLIQ